MKLADAMLHSLILPGLLVLTLTVGTVAAQDRPPPPGHEGKGEHRSPFPGHPGFKYGGFDKLSDTDKERVRKAMDQAWQKPEMQVAKEKFMKASDEFRKSLRETLQGIDPEVVKILEKIKPPMPWEMRGPPPQPRPDDPNFARHALARLGFEFMAFGKPEQRDAMRKLHERVMQLTPVKEAVAHLETAPQEQRMEAFRKLREAYRLEVEREISEYRRRLKPEEAKQ